jgi:enamine deaminase RidA (YjgF/YER057c/UK114 family)
LPPRAILAFANRDTDVAAPFERQKALKPYPGRDVGSPRWQARRHRVSETHGVLIIDVRQQTTSSLVTDFKDFSQRNPARRSKQQPSSTEHLIADHSPTWLGGGSTPQQNQGASMTINLTNPAALAKVDFHRQVAIASGSKLVFMAGQVAWDADGTLVGKGDLAAQVEQCYLNVAAAVAEAGGNFDDVAKLTIYITDWTPDKMSLVQEGRARALAKIGVTSLAPGTLIGAAALFTPDILVEIEAIAVID